MRYSKTMSELEPAMRSQPRRTSTAAIIGFVLGIVGIAPFALVFSYIGLIETRDRGVQGRVFAVLGMVIGGFGTLLLVLWLVLWLASRG